MQEKYRARLDVKIYTIDSKEAEPYHFRSSTHVIFENEYVPLDVALDRKKMDAFLSANL